MPSDDYIKKADAVFAVQKRIEQIGMGNNPHVCSIRQAVRDVPASDVEPVWHGRWVWGYDMITCKHEYICDQCGYAPYYDGSIYNYKYCPNCGAKMQGEEAPEVRCKGEDCDCT